mmetsp:Transcript_128733/g.360219  ORF Transcript_128733/g.360219 Transcript_128733/m.360219 type:complete len:212 (-) Transcript_128733:1381-2016(-)
MSTPYAMTTCLIWGRSHVVLSIFLTLVFMKDSSSCSRLMINGSPSSFQSESKTSKIRPSSTSLGPNLSVSFSTQDFFWHNSTLISIMGLFEFQSTRSLRIDFSVGKFFQGSRCTELYSISFMISSKHANRESWPARGPSLLEDSLSSVQSSESHWSQKPVAMETGLSVWVEPKVTSILRATSSLMGNPMFSPLKTERRGFTAPNKGELKPM